MKLIGLTFCILSVFLVYKRFALRMFGKSAKGVIIGFDSPVRGT